MAHCARGDEYIVGQMAHTYRWEGGGAAVLGSIQPQPLNQAADGTMALAEIEAAIKPDDAHFARTRLLALENTWGGKVLPVAYVEQATALARRRGLATHLDGARLFNAAVASGVPARQIAQHFDSVSVCFSKGLGAPAGSALVRLEGADRARPPLRARCWAAACARPACWPRRRCTRWTTMSSAWPRTTPTRSGWPKACRACPGVTVELPQTNIVFVDLAPEKAAGVVERLRAAGVLCTGLYKLRFVTHLDVSRADIDRAMRVLRAHPLRRRLPCPSPTPKR